MSTHPPGFSRGLLLLAASLALVAVACDGDVEAGVDAASTDAGPVDAPSDAPAIDAPASAACGLSNPPETWYVDRATPSPDGEGWCCAPGAPTCDCGYFGGFVRDRCACGDHTLSRGLDSPFGWCDLSPLDWVHEVDAHGCPRYRTRNPTTACCNC